MKKIIAALVLIFMLSNKSQAQTDSTTTTTTTTTSKTATGPTKYLYYPEANVYFNEATNSYTYFDPLTSTWITNPKLPPTYSIGDKAERDLVTYNGAEVWKDNDVHQKKYRKAMKKLSKASPQR